jgi:4-hydroxybenzoate polyprenyltransferase
MTALKSLFWSSRPISWVNTAVPFAAAYFFAGGEIGIELIVLSLFFLIPYNLLMYGINDVFDYESDLRNPRKGGIEGALLAPELHRNTLLWSFGLAAPFVAYAVWVSLENLAALVVLVITIFAVIAYSVKGLRFKEVPFLDSITSSTHFVGPMLFGLLLSGAELGTSLLLATAAFFLWGAASHAFGAVQDIRADREAGIASVATSLGARNTVRLAVALYLVAGLMLLALPDRFWQASFAALPYLIVVGPQLAITDETCEQANRGWRRFLLLNFLAGAWIMALLIGPS